MHRKIRLALIYGSTRPNRLCDRVVEIERRGDFALDAIDPVLPDAEGGLRNPEVAA